MCLFANEKEQHTSSQQADVSPKTVAQMVLYNVLKFVHQ